MPFPVPCAILIWVRFYTSTDENDHYYQPYEMSLDVAYSLMLSEKFSLAAAVRWIYSDMRFSETEENSPASAFAADIAAYYQNYVNIGQRECQLVLVEYFQYR